MRAVIAEDAVLLREGLSRLLTEGGFDVCVVDIRMPPTFSDEGVRAALVIRKQWPDVSLLMLSQYVEERYAVDLIGEGAEGVGYQLKDRVGDLDEFADAVRRVGEGGSVLDPEVVTRMLARPRHDNPMDDLSPRERDVLELMAQGRSNQGIAENSRARQPPISSAAPRCARGVICDRAPGSAARPGPGGAPGRRAAGRA